MLKNVWERVEFRCLEHNVPMYVYEGSMTPFYACPKYMKKDDQHPNGHEEDEKGCSNRVSFEVCRHLVEMLSREMENALLNGEIIDFKGYQLHWRLVDAEVLKYTNDKIVLGVRNRKDVDAWHS